MRYHFVADSIGNALYFDHADGRLLCLPFSTTQDVLHENFGERVKTIKVGDVTIATSRFDDEDVLYAIVSDEGEPEHSLNSQLYMIHELFFLLYGPPLQQFVKLQKYDALLNPRAKLRLRRIIDSACHFFKTHISGAIQGVEYLDVNDDLRRRCAFGLEHGVSEVLLMGERDVSSPPLSPSPPSNSNEHDLESVEVHAPAETNASNSKDQGNESASERQNVDELQVQRPSWTSFLPQHTTVALFVGSKFVVQFAAPKSEPLNASDLFLLATMGQAHWNPHIREYEAMNDAPTADYTLYAKGLKEQGKSEGKGKGEGEGVTVIGTLDEVSRVEEEAVDLDTMDTMAPVQPQNQIHAEGEEVKEVKVQLDGLEAVDDDAVEIPIEELDTDTSTNTNTMNTNTPLFEVVYLRHFGDDGQTVHPSLLYAAEIAPRVRLYIVSRLSSGDSVKGNNHWSKKRHLACERMKALVHMAVGSYVDFLIIKESTHMTMLSYLQQFPGLVHFIFVDRFNGQVVTPKLVPLHGNLNLNPSPSPSSGEPESQSESEPSASGSGSGSGSGAWQIAAFSAGLLSEKVWEMCSISQQYASKGYSSMLVRAGDFQYSYRLWFETADGETLSMDMKNYNSGTRKLFADLPVSPASYRKLLRALHPNQARNGHCYELYTMYVGLVPSLVVASHNQRLTEEMMERRASSAAYS